MDYPLVTVLPNNPVVGQICRLTTDDPYTLRVWAPAKTIGYQWIKVRMRFDVKAAFEEWLFHNSVVYQHPEWNNGRYDDPAIQQFWEEAIKEICHG